MNKVDEATSQFEVCKDDPEIFNSVIDSVMKCEREGLCYSATVWYSLKVLGREGGIRFDEDKDEIEVD